jgi:FAD dependent oxidoreductase
MTNKKLNAELGNYNLHEKILFVVGTFDDGVTVLSQQTRSLNLVTMLVELNIVPTTLVPKSADTSHKIAIVGCGISGLTVAAGLIKKGVRSEISLFEQRDTLLPLQQGSDTRWLHPKIYNWPEEGSNSSSAMLPVMNWTAARASDVAVQLLAEWREVLSEGKVNSSGPRVRLYCNVRHLDIASEESDRIRIEWVGEERRPDDATKDDLNSPAAGQSEAFDIVILAVGFGLEGKGTTSYWRNETLGQPSLNSSRQTFLVSGQGDGAIVDVLRLRISQFRQDRILGEIFTSHSSLLRRLKEIYAEFKHNDFRNGDTLFDKFEVLRRDPQCGPEFLEVEKELRRRLRRDTEVVLQLKHKTLTQFLKARTGRISFQNALLIFLLYKAGGVTPTTDREAQNAIAQYGVTRDHIVRRHGVSRKDVLSGVLSADLLEKAAGKFPGLSKEKGALPRQRDVPFWDGGYFGFRGVSKNAPQHSEKVKANWRKEYLPNATQLIATALGSAVAGYIKSLGLKHDRLRVTLHRSLAMRDSDELLQQACEYCGEGEIGDGGAGRTFPAHNGTIGLSYITRSIIRSSANCTAAQLQDAMGKLHLNDASRKMSTKVRFVLAVPLLEPPNNFTMPSPVAAVLYVDSTGSGFFLGDQQVEVISRIVGQCAGDLARVAGNLSRMPNVRVSGLCSDESEVGSFDHSVAGALEIVSSVVPPQLGAPFYLNFDYSDFVPASS